MARKSDNMVARVHFVVDVPFTADVDKYEPDIGPRASADGVERVGLRDAAHQRKQSALVEAQRRNAAKDAEDLAKELSPKVKFGSVVNAYVEEVRDA